jgi:hypothetical protein
MDDRSKESEQTDLFSLVRGRNDEIKALDQLFLRSLKYRNSKTYFELLQFINRLPGLSPFNAFLIHMQYPGAQFVASAKKWERDYGRTVKRDALPFVILVPFGPVEFVYDIADTEGPDLPRRILDPFEAIGRLDKDAYDLTVMNCKRHNIPVFESDLGSGFGGYAQRRLGDFSISVNKNHLLNVRYASLTHELGHIYAGHVGTTDETWWPDRSGLPKEIKEIEAESISFLVCRRIGIETNAEEYLAGYVAAHEEMPLFSLDTVLTVPGYIGQMGRSLLKPRKPESKKKRR